MSRQDFEPLVWAGRGIGRVEARCWWEGGFTLEEAVCWRERFSAEEAAGWRRAGVRNLGEARSWCVAGVAAAEVRAWLDAGIGFAEAAAWREFGYTRDEARALKAEGKTPSSTYLARIRRLRGASRRPARQRTPARLFAVPRPGPAQPAHRFILQTRGKPGNIISSYLSRQWFDDEALRWAGSDIDAADALVWKELGLTPEEAGRLHKSGVTPAATIRAWWQAGIPFDEVAAWLGAGLTPAEAATQRANGVSADRASVMRALRGTGGTPPE